MADPDGHRLIEAIYAHGTDPERFPELLQCLADAFEADAANCSIVDLDAGAGNLAFVHGMHPDAVRDYREHYCGEDQWFIGARRARTRPGVVYPGSFLIPDSKLRRSAFVAGGRKRVSRSGLHSGHGRIVRRDRS